MYVVLLKGISAWDDKIEGITLVEGEKVVPDVAEAEVCTDISVVKTDTEDLREGDHFL